jgi:hypothetical protein
VKINGCTYVIFKFWPRGMKMRKKQKLDGRQGGFDVCRHAARRRRDNMYCAHCGQEMQERDGFCPHCGTKNIKVEPGNPVAGTQPTPASVKPERKENGETVLLGGEGDAAIVAAKNYATLKIGDAEISIRAIMLILAAVELLLFFLPWVHITCQGESLTQMSGLELSMGKTVSIMGDEADLEGNALVFTMLAIPALMFIIYWVKKELSFLHKGLFTFSTVLSIVGFIGLIIVRSATNSDAAEEGATASWTTWYMMALVIYVVSSIVSIGSILFGQKPE